MTLEDFKTKMGRPKLYEHPDEMSEPAFKYFESIKEQSKPNPMTPNATKIMPTMAGLALALGMTRQTLHDYSKKDDFSYTVGMFKAIVEKDWEQALIGGGAGAIFWNKVNAGYDDKIVVDNNIDVKSGQIVAYIPSNGRLREVEEDNTEE